MPTKQPAQPAGASSKKEAGLRAVSFRIPWGVQLFAFLLRLAMGWIFLYAGYHKLRYGFTAEGFLAHATSGPWKDWFVSLGQSPSALDVIDPLVMYGQVLIGGALILGLFTRFALLMGAAMMFLFYIAQFPPEYDLFLDYYIVYILVYLMLGVLAAGRVWGLDGYLEKNTKLFQAKWLKGVMG
jgi:thiosulfate dehydrogenase [quinone] large subunit